MEVSCWSYWDYNIERSSDCMWLWSLDHECIPYRRLPSHPWRNLLPCCGTNSYGLISHRFWCYMAAVFFPSAPHWLGILFLGCVWSRRVANECMAYPGAHASIWWYIFSSHWCLLWPTRFQKTSLHHSISGILYMSLVHVSLAYRLLWLTLLFSRFLCHRKHLCQLYYS